ncbi:DUF5620 domain-containing protein [Ruminococcus callidus]|uniref:DUF5620 domain-containing protein n=1 Tax=Ruminococcus callidus TaxID=40519 RepID=UPI0023F4486F|nr:DUF5620 domain-containing protein [Ruminococcus callidus]
MKMKKFLSSLTAGVMAATTILTSALVTPMMSLAATAADDAIGTATLIGTVGSNQNWEADTNAVSIGGDGEYTVSWDMTTASDSISFLAVQINPAGDTENFTTDTFKDLKVSLGSVSINGEEVTDAIKDDKIINTAFYENGKAGVTRIYLNGSWAGSAGALDNFDASKVENGISTISVTFTVEGTGKTTTTTTTVPVATETTTTTTNETTAETSVETTAASSATTAATTVTTAEEKGVKKITVGKTYSELLKEAQKADPKEGMIGWKWADFGITNSNVVKKVVVNVSSDKEIGTYNYMFGSSTQKAPDYWTQTTQENKTLGKSGEFTWDITKTVDATIQKEYDGSLKFGAWGDGTYEDFTVDSVVIYTDDATITTTAATTVTTKPTTTVSAKYTKELTPKAEEDKGTDGKASNTKVEFDPMGAYKAIAYYTVKTNDKNTSGAFGTWNDSLPEGEEWQSTEFKDLAVPANKQVIVSYDIPKTVGETVQFMVYYPKFGDVTIDKIVLCFDEDPDQTTTSTTVTTVTTETVATTEESTVSATTEETTVTSKETTKETTVTTVATTADTTAKTTASTSTEASAETSKATETSASAATTTAKKTTATKADTTVVTTTKSISTTTTEAPKGKGIIFKVDEVQVKTASDYAKIPLSVLVENYVDAQGFNFALEVPEVTSKILTIYKNPKNKKDYGYKDVYVSGDLAPSPQNLKGYEANGKDMSVEPSKRWMYFQWTSSTSTITISGDKVIDINCTIAENAVDIAKEYGLELQTDENGDSYYLFPVNFAEYQKVNWDFEGTHGDGYLAPNRQYIDENGTDIATTDVVYYNGGIRVYTDAQTETTTSDTITTTTTTATEEKDINLDIDEVFVYPSEKDATSLKNYTLGVKVTAKEGVDATSYGINCVVNLPEATAKLYTIPSKLLKKRAFVVNDFGSGIPNANDFIAYKDGTSTITDGSDRWIRFIGARSAEGATDPTKMNQVFRMIFNVPDKDTVQALADEYGLTLQTGEYDGKTVEYYEFPVDWAPNGSDRLPSGTTMVDVKRFNYLNGEGVTGEDIFDEMVGLKDGAIRVIMNDVVETTETTTATTTTTTTTTTTATTAATTTTTEEPQTTTATEATTVTTTTAATTTTTTAATITTTEEPIVTTTEATTTTAEATTVTTKATTATATSTSAGPTTTSTSATTTTVTESETTTTKATTTATTEELPDFSKKTTASTTEELPDFSKKTTTSTTTTTTTTTEETTEATTEATTEETTTTPAAVSSTTEATTTEATTTVTEATTTTENTTASTEATTTTEVTTTTAEAELEIEVNPDANFYLSIDGRNFNAADLVKSATVNGESVMDDLTFGAESPKALFDSEGKAYVDTDLDILYKGEKVATAKVYIGVKGDTDLSGSVDSTDMFYSCYYVARLGAGYKTSKLLDGTKYANDANLEKLSFFLTDIDTESKAGENNDATGNINSTDLFYQTYYVALMGAGYKSTTWDNPVCPDLKNLKGSMWAE